MLSRLTIFGLCIGLSALCLVAAPRTERIKFYHGIAEGNYLIGDLKGAERGIEQMLRLDPDYLPALTLKTRVMLDQNNPGLALESVEHALKQEPGNPRHILLKALVLGRMERRDEASALVEQVIAQASPKSNDARAAHQLLGLLRMAAGEWDEAADAFTNIYMADPATAETSLRLINEAYLEKAQTAMKVGKRDEAIAAIDQAIAIYQDQTGKDALRQRTALRLTRARLLAQFSRPEAAIKDLQILTGQQPENYEALITLASLYASVGRWDSLETAIEPIADRREFEDIALYLEGRAALAKNRVGTARVKFEEAINSLSTEAEQLRRSLNFYRGLCLAKLDRPSEAETSILNAIDAGFIPETSQEALVASRFLLRADRVDEAIPILEAITLNHIEPGAAVWAMLGRAHLASDTPTLALSAFNESLRIAPEQVEARALRGSLLRKIGDLEGALVDYKVAQDLAPGNASIAYASGLVYLQLGRIPEAEQTIFQAASQLENNAGLHLLHALLAYALGKTDQAVASLRAYQAKISEKQNPTALYLNYLLDPEGSKKLNRSEISQYFNGTFTRKQALDAAGRAETPAQARQQICAAAYWMAQFEQKNGNKSAERELLQIAVDAGDPDLTEYQLSKWELAK